ncbi:MAG: hypothetical protein J6X16_09585 [Bacteroidales bacterium]|nr:hypothetical protein [Bacteroidales bacterium]
MIRFLFLFLTLPFLSCSISEEDPIGTIDQVVQDTTTSIDTIIEVSPDTALFLYKHKETNAYAMPPQEKKKTHFDWGFIAVLIALIALCVNFIQSKKSSNQAEKTYDKFVTTSEKQFNIQTNTLETIKNQTEKIYSNNNKRDFIGYLSDCYTSIGLVGKYLKDNFSNIIWNVQTNDYVFGLLQPAIKAATAMEITLSSLEEFDNNEEFVNSVKLCAKLGEKEFINREDVELMIHQLEECKIVFEKYIKKLKGGQNE